MAILGVNRRRNRRAKRKADAAADAYEDAYANRQKEIERERMAAQQSAVFATTEGEGIMEGAAISLGFIEEEDEEDMFGSGTGLII